MRTMMKHTVCCGSMFSSPALTISAGQQNIDHSARDFDQDDGGTTHIGTDVALVNA